jgi:lysophospholipid acyltransferase (LPLAT)-like uncharacterized protein
MSAMSQKMSLALGPGLAVAALRALGTTWVHAESGHAELSPLGKGPRCLYCFWHGVLLSAVWHYRGLPIRALASRNHDGEIIARALLKLGYPDPARGSSSRGGATALRDLATSLRAQGHGLLTPDGPRGPRHQAQAGVLMLARLTGLPLVPVGVASTRCLRLKSWDRFEVPLPFAKNLFHFGAPLWVPPQASHAELEALSLKLQASMESLSHAAERELR